MAHSQKEARIETLFGRHAIHEVLRAARRKVYKITIAEGAGERATLAGILELAKKNDVSVRRVKRQLLDEQCGHHQGVAALVSPYPYVKIESILAQATKRKEPPLVLLLDTIQDPQNLGTLLRTAEAVGVHGVIIAHRRGARITDAVVRSSAGASEYLLIAALNLPQAITKLKKNGVWIAGIERSAEARLLGEADLRGPLGLVVGSEGTGMRRLVRESCDFILRLPMRGKIDSLNAAVAGSIALYEIWRARGYDGDKGTDSAGMEDSDLA